jgi:hypothetical protein
MLADATALFGGGSRRVRLLPRAVLCAALVLGLGAVAARAQPAGLNVGRDCQTIRTCNFSRGGGYRGCLSSYSCRICRFVRSGCSIDGSRRICQQMRCTWG